MSNKLIGILGVCIISVSIAGCSINKSVSDENPKDTLISFSNYKQNNQKDIKISGNSSQLLLTQEDLVNMSALIVKGKLKKAKGIAMTQGEMPCIVYELKISDTIVNNVNNTDDVVNFIIPDSELNGVNNNDRIKLDKEYIFYLDDYAEAFPNLKEKYYGVMSEDQGFQEVNMDEKSFKEHKDSLLKLKNPKYKNPLVSSDNK